MLCKSCDLLVDNYQFGDKSVDKVRPLWAKVSDFPNLAVTTTATLAQYHS
jgi:hypothetical protein